MEQTIKHLIGAKITAIRHMTDKECDNLGFRNHSVLIKLDNGTILIPFMDNEMNDGGAIGVLNNGFLSTLYSK